MVIRLPLLAWIKLYKIPQQLVDYFITNHDRRFTSEYLIAVMRELIVSNRMDPQVLPPAFKWIPKQDMVVFDMKLFDQTYSLWLLQDNYHNLSNDYIVEQINQHSDVNKPWMFCRDLQVPQFIPHGLQAEIVDNKAMLSYRDDKKRITTTIGKAIRKMEWPFELTDSEVESVSNTLKAIIAPNLTMKIVSGEDIRKYYLGTKYKANSGSLSNSCMRYHQCQEYFDVYVDNDVEMLIAVDDLDFIHGRALLWPRSMWNKNYWDGVPYIMDRIYGSDKTIEMFKMYARERNWVYKTYQRYDERLNWVAPIDGEYQNDHKRCRMNLEFYDYNSWPYVDTFAMFDNNEGCLKNFGDGARLTSTDGYIEDHRRTCDGCGNDVCEDDIYFIDGDAYCSECSVYSEYHDQNFHRDDVTWSDYYHDYILHNDAYEITHGDQRGEWIHSEDTICVYLDGYCHKDDYYSTGDNTPVQFLKKDRHIAIAFNTNQVYRASIEEDYNDACWTTFLNRIYENGHTNDDSVEIAYVNEDHEVVHHDETTLRQFINTINQADLREILIENHYA